jgi:hypothetical protein
MPSVCLSAKDLFAMVSTAAQQTKLDKVHAARRLDSLLLFAKVVMLCNAECVLLVVGGDLVVNKRAGKVRDTWSATCI